MELTAILGIVQLIAQVLPAAQQATAGLVGMLRATSPIINPTAPAAVHAAHPSAFLMSVQKYLNAQLGLNIDVDGVYGPQTENALKQELQKYGITLPAV